MPKIKEKEVIQRILDIGPVMPNPKWTKGEIIDHCAEMYRDLETLRKFILAISQRELEGLCRQ